jgi:hypothetical protein
MIATACWRVKQPDVTRALASFGGNRGSRVAGLLEAAATLAYDSST